MEQNACFRNDDAMRGLKCRDLQYLKALHENHYGKLLGIISRRVSDERPKKEIFQRTFLRIWFEADQYDPVASTLFTWMFNICVKETAAYLNIDRSKMQEYFLKAFQQSKASLQTH